MNLKLLWTTAALLTTALAMPSVGLALERKSVDRTDQRKNLKATSSQPLPSAQSTHSLQVAPDRLPTLKAANDTIIARVQPHQLAGHMAATLLVRNIPVLTFTGDSEEAANSTKAGTNGIDNAPKFNNEFQRLNAPIKRAQVVAAALNQMYANNLDASTIRAVWEPGGQSITSSKSQDKTTTKNQRDRYLITVKDAVLVEIDSSTRLPDTIHSPAKDALLATNRLRQLMGNAPPVSEISGQVVALPKDRFLEEITLGPVRISLSGLASWYNFHENGSETASGESFNDNELTAAHLTLPFGTQVRVTNALNGRSVVVRINDRGPYIAGRMIDLSTAAASLLGMIEPGVVPVRVDVLGQATPADRGVSVGAQPGKKPD